MPIDGVNDQLTDVFNAPVTDALNWVVTNPDMFGALGINLCFHRLITHRSFSCPRWLEHAFVVIAVCSVQDSPAHWAAVHRRHHHKFVRPLFRMLAGRHHASADFVPQHQRQGMAR